MLKQLFIRMLLLVSFLSAHCKEYLYPVLSCMYKKSSLKVLLMHQQDQRVELLLWDPVTKVASKALHSVFMPAGISMLPDNSGFSFIDNGRIRIKSFNKRSPKTLDIYEPIYDIGIVSWIDNDTAYFSAKKKEHYGIFQLSIKGEVIQLAGSMVCDCMYPQKIGSDLFYIEREFDNAAYHYEIVHAPYPVTASRQFADFNDISSYHQRVEAFLRKECSACKQDAPPLIAQAQTIVNFGDRPLLFLQMISPHQGFVLEYKNCDNASKLAFTCHYLEKIGSAWNSRSLFSFVLPSQLFLPTSSDRLHESLLPLLPRYYDKKIYFADCSACDSLDIYYYDLLTETIIRKTAVPSPHYHFVPIIVGTTLYYGGSEMPDLYATKSCADDDQSCDLILDLSMLH